MSGYTLGAMDIAMWMKTCILIEKKDSKWKVKKKVEEKKEKAPRRWYLSRDLKGAMMWTQDGKYSRQRNHHVQRSCGRDRVCKKRTTPLQGGGTWAGRRAQDLLGQVNTLDFFLTIKRSHTWLMAREWHDLCARKQTKEMLNNSLTWHIWETQSQDRVYSIPKP